MAPALKHCPQRDGFRVEVAVQPSVSILGLSTLSFAAVPQHHRRVPRWLTHLGAPGLFVIAVIDSSVIPLPIPGSTDLLLLWLVAHRGNPFLLAACSIAGSLVGGYTTWRLGKKGGEAGLRRYVPKRHLDRIVGWVQGHPVLAVFLPAVLPPPIPLSPFLLAAGALGIARNRFLAAFGAARCFRYSLIAWLAAAYGRRIVRLWSSSLDRFSTPLLCIFLILLAVSFGYAIWKMRRPRQTTDTVETESA